MSRGPFAQWVAAMPSIRQSWLLRSFARDARQGMKSPIRNVSSVIEFENIERKNDKDRDGGASLHKFPAIRIKLTINPTEEDKQCPGFQLPKDINDTKCQYPYDFVMAYARELAQHKQKLRSASQSGKRKRESREPREQRNQNKSQSTYHERNDSRQEKGGYAEKDDRNRDYDKNDGRREQHGSGRGHQRSNHNESVAEHESQNVISRGGGNKRGLRDNFKRPTEEEEIRSRRPQFTERTQTQGDLRKEGQVKTRGGRPKQPNQN